LDYDREYTKSIQNELDELQFELNKIREVERRANAQKLAEEKRLQKLKEEEDEKRRKEEELKARVMAQQLEQQKKTNNLTKDSLFKANKAQQVAEAKKRYVTESIQKQKTEQLIRQKNDSLMRERVIKKKLDEERQQQALQVLADKKKHEIEEKNRQDSIRFASIQIAVNQKKEESIQAVIKAKEDNTAYDTKDDRPKINIEEIKGINLNDTIVKINYFEKDSSGTAEEAAKANFNRKLSHEEQEKFFADLLLKYPEGVTLEEDVYQGFKIKRIIAKQNNTACEYKIIEFNFGLFFKRNDTDLTEDIFKKEVKGFDAYFHK